jgi:hypothetical protein
VPTTELRDPDAARRFLLQGLWMQRVRRPAVETVQPVLEWGLEIASGGGPLPSLGFVADVGHLAFQHGEPDAVDRAPADVPGWDHADVRTYEDYALGKLYSDATFERAANAVAHYPADCDRSRGLAFLIRQMQQRVEFGGVQLSPGILKELLRQPAEELHAEGWDSLRGGVDPLLRELHAGLVAAMRNAGHVLGGEDVFELEHKTALAEFAQRVALRQVLKAASLFDEAVPRQPPRTSARAEQVPTHLRDEDLYPVGGFTSLSNRGTIESLLHSQLAYMETAIAERPDLFDVKFLRDELLYYSRDENQFFRRRRTIVFALFPDLAECRVKDAGLPSQRIVLLLGALAAIVRRLIEWLRDDALRFELLFVESADPAEVTRTLGSVRVTDRFRVLADERELLEMIFREQIANGTVVVESVKPEAVARRCREHARRSLCHCTTLSVRDRPLEAEATVVTRLRLNAAAPALLGDGIEEADEDDSQPKLTAWHRTAEALLKRLV